MKIKKQTIEFNRIFVEGDYFFIDRFHGEGILIRDA
jgi:hypothetical protein